MKKLDKIIRDIAEENVDIGCAKKAIIEAVIEELPKWKLARTYASENADIYRAYDKGFKDCLAETIRKLRQS